MKNRHVVLVYSYYKRVECYRENTKSVRNLAQSLQLKACGFGYQNLYHPLSPTCELLF